MVRMKIIMPAVCLILFMAAVRAHAAFPADMDKNPVVCRPLDRTSSIEYYSDSDLSTLKGSVDSEDFVLKATRQEGDAIYGSFTKDGNPETGWFDLDAFVADDDYKHKYFTVRSKMDVYTDSSLDEEQDRIKKYSGVIVIGKGDGSRQVIYQKKNGYGIGWMYTDDLKNTLIYDGREKQTLSDGEYLFRCGYRDDENGGAPIREQAGLKGREPRRWQLTHVTGDQYYIKDTSSGKYITLYTKDHGLTYGLCRTQEPDPEYSLFHLQRASGSYTIRSVKSGQYLAQDEKGELNLERYRCHDNACWRLSTAKKELNADAPMVFTQYDPAWCGTAYGSEGCMGTAGCGILAPVNAVYALSGQYMDVMELADYAVEKEYRIIGSGTDEGIFKAACKRFGQKYNFAWDGRGGKIKELKKKLAKGDTAVVHVEGHYVAIVDYDEKTGKFLMLDSNYLPKREDTAFGDWISENRLTEGTLEAQQFYYFKLRDPVNTLP